MKMRLFFIISLLWPLLAGSQHHRDYPIQAVPFTALTLTDDFWKPRIKVNHQTTIPIAFGHCESTGRIRNFEVAGGISPGTFCTKYPFDDSDVFKIIEGAAYSLQTFPDPALDAYLDTLIMKISTAQEDDGYLYTNRTILGDSGHPWIGTERWQNTHLHSHELYNMGHLFEAAVAHYRATGKSSLLNVAVRAADRIDEDFGPDARISYPGHQGIGIGLVKLYHLTNETRYLELARFFLDARGDGPEYCQAHLPVTQQREAVGHAVRATYMYAEMADVAAITKDTAYIHAITAIWDDITGSKMYVTGGIGATAGNEGFAEPYFMPSRTAYCETCASIGNILFNHRLFLLHADARYYDVLERTLYNAMLAGVSLSGDRFFYSNPLESGGEHQRSEWFGCACCPSNICRFIPSVPGYVYATGQDEIFVNLYMSNEALIPLGDDTIGVVQQTDYPWDGKVAITLDPKKKSRFTLRLRIPEWTGEAGPAECLYYFADSLQLRPGITINGVNVAYRIENGYAMLNRQWKPGDELMLYLPMEVRRVRACEKVEDARGKVAFQRGPIVFAAEGADNNGRVLDLLLDEDVRVSTLFENNLLNGAQTLSTKAMVVNYSSPEGPVILVPVEMKLIPYHLWNNRGPGEMRVWFPLEGM